MLASIYEYIAKELFLYVFYVYIYIIFYIIFIDYILN